MAERELEDWLPAGITRPARAPGRPRTADLNAIDFEGLVRLGVSVGQAARFISQRDRRGGLDSLEYIDSFHGLAPGVRDVLRWNGHV